MLLSCSLSGQYRTQPLSDDVHTIQVEANGNWGTNPVVKLNSNESINISFDRLGDNSYKRLRYKIYHCDVQWQKSKEISEIDYLDGFNDNLVEDYSNSLNTTIDYTHFNLSIPNSDISLKLSGNYVVQFYEEEVPQQILLNACFSVLDDKVKISGQVSPITDIDANKAHQQLSFTINHNLNLRNSLEEIKVIVRQNDRLDTQRNITKPSFNGNGILQYEHIRDLIFEAGNEYRRFESSSYRYNGLNVGHIEYSRPYYIMNILPDKIRANSSYSYDQDQNGRYAIRNTETGNEDAQADYFIINFTLQAPRPLPQDIYINGNFTYNTYNDKYKMQYDTQQGAYFISLLLKQGLYNYQYLTKSGNTYSTATIEGNYYEAENEYIVSIYYHPSGQRYDSFIGQSNFYSRRK